MRLERVGKPRVRSQDEAGVTPNQEESVPSAGDPRVRASSEKCDHVLNAAWVPRISNGISVQCVAEGARVWSSRPGHETCTTLALKQ